MAGSLPSKRLHQAWQIEKWAWKYINVKLSLSHVWLKALSLDTRGVKRIYSRHTTREVNDQRPKCEGLDARKGGSESGTNCMDKIISSGESSRPAISHVHDYVSGYTCNNERVTILGSKLE